MIELIKRFFGNPVPADSTDPQPSAAHDVHIATCALLIEMAGIDGEFSQMERDRIIDAFKRDHGLSDAHVSQLLESAENELKKSTDLWQFTHRINKNYSTGEKIRIIELIWEVIYSDGTLDKHEDYLVHKLGTLLRLTHKQLIDAKLKVKSSL